MNILHVNYIEHLYLYIYLNENIPHNSIWNIYSKHNIFNMLLSEIILIIIILNMFIYIYIYIYIYKFYNCNRL